MPYVYNWSQDVDKCTLYPVLSHCTRTNAIQATVLASKECPSSYTAFYQHSVWLSSCMRRLPISPSQPYPPGTISYLEQLQQGWPPCAACILPTLQPANPTPQGPSAT